MSQKGTIIITGANGALGSALAKQLTTRRDLVNDYTAIYTVRKTKSAAQLNGVLKGAPASHKYETVELDLGSLANIRKTADNINKKVASGQIPPIRALILNAGYQDHTTLTMSEDGYEMTWQVNYLSNVVLSLLLLQSMDKKNGRILIVGSWSHDLEDPRNETGGNLPYKGLSWDSLYPGAEQLAKGLWNRPEDDPSWYAGYRRYGASKSCVVMFQQELSRRVASDPKLSKIPVIALDPGGMSSDLGRRGSFYFSKILMKVVMPTVAPVSQLFNPNGELRTPTKSAGDVVRACFDIEVRPEQNLYLNGTDEIEVSRVARDATKRRELWEYGIKAGGLKEGDTALSNWQ